MPSLWWTSVAFGLSGALSAYAQTSNITQCMEGWQWAVNTQKQTPCLVAAFLESACGTPTSVDGIPIGSHYLGPTGPQQNQCICSSVTYSLVSACGGCQGRTFQNWTTWSMNCDKPSLATFPLPIPPAVVVPPWAYINVSFTGDKLDPIIAQAVASGGPTPSTPVVSPSSTAAPTTTPLLPSPAATTTAPTTSTSVPAASKGTNTGAIAGGVVGGLLVLAIIVLAAIWWFVWRRRNAVQSDLVFNKGALISNNPPIVTQQATGSSGIPLTSLYDTTTGSNYPPSAYGTSAIYTSAPTASRRSEDSISYSLAHFGGLGGGQPPSLQPVRQQPGFYRGAAELS
ncbi:hypothetical protein D9619_005901 [Psilocybe cf. subviscida]|uniref:Mid2 domain-containing protein n=1 Tax=Psilocybe cf. subviscida TaxID=2480587 RepID=A0A8H5BVJ5_9AGAR|nr:hypothetical protein D9619_005901 [Psilocybe cf. subviscida]